MQNEYKAKGGGIGGMVVDAISSDEFVKTELHIGENASSDRGNHRWDG
jgi:hypothetical protein